MDKASSNKKLKAIQAQEGNKIKTHVSSTSPTDTKVPKRRSIMKRVPESSLPKRLSLSLTPEEIMEDLEAMTQKRHLRSRHKRNPTLQKQIDKLCPMVSEAVYKPELYEVSEDDEESSEDETKEDKEEQKDSLCGLCGEKYTFDEFWIGCDFCEMWFHGLCVKITPAKAKHIKMYKCPACA